MTDKKFGVVGNPISHSLSPLIHRTAYEFYGFNYSYQPYLVESGQLANFILSNRDLNGLSVTMPLKFEAAGLSVLSDESATHTGVVNTLTFSSSNVTGFNTDVYGIVKALDVLGNDSLKSVGILGSGATARSAIEAIGSIYQGAAIRVFLRSEVAQIELERLFKPRLNISFHQLDQLTDEFDLVINTIPGDMSFNIFKTKYLLDVNYSSEQIWPASTTVISGLEMLIWQAIAQMRIWYFNSSAELPDEPKLVELIRDSLLAR